MNTFAVLLLAFPFYLAVNSRLVAYTNLVTSKPSNASQANSTATATAVKPITPIG